MSAEPAPPAPESARCEQLQRELAQARAELEDFTYSVSHDLRASLRHVTSYVQIIQEDLDESPDADISAHLTTVANAARQMGRQMDALMALSRLTRAELQRTPLALGDLAREVMAELLAAAQPGRALTWQVASDVPRVMGDAALVRQVLTHLLSNALKFSGPRAQAVIALSWAPADDGQCVVTVADNGVGFNPQYQGKLFRAFQRLHSPRDFEGLGMGLALTRKTIERLGGRVWADGALDAGCRISFTLPCVPPGA